MSIFAFTLSARRYENLIFWNQISREIYRFLLFSLQKKTTTTDENRIKFNNKCSPFYNGKFSDSETCYFSESKKKNPIWGVLSVWVSHWEREKCVFDLKRLINSFFRDAPKQFRRNKKFFKIASARFTFQGCDNTKKFSVHLFNKVTRENQFSSVPVEPLFAVPFTTKKFRFFPWKFSLSVDCASHWNWIDQIFSVSNQHFA
jgi:hypothetical protein